MRSRKEVEADAEKYQIKGGDFRLLLEVLLDIRDLLDKIEKEMM